MIAGSKNFALKQTRSRCDAPEARRLVGHRSGKRSDAGLVHGIDDVPEGQRGSLQRSLQVVNVVGHNRTVKDQPV